MNERTNDIRIYGIKEKQSTHDLSLIREWAITQVNWLSFSKDTCIRTWTHRSSSIHLVNERAFLQIYFTLSVIKFVYIDVYIIR